MDFRFGLSAVRSLFTIPNPHIVASYRDNRIVLDSATSSAWSLDEYLELDPAIVTKLHVSTVTVGFLRNCAQMRQDPIILRVGDLGLYSLLEVA